MTKTKIGNLHKAYKPIIAYSVVFRVFDHSI